MNQIASINNSLTMSSREIATLTDKQHHHVMRDIRSMLEELGEEQKPFLDFDNSGANGRRVEFFNLDRDHTECLLTGYSVRARMRVIKRWRELEESNSVRLPQTFAEALQLAADQAKQLEIAAPKVEFHDKIVNDAATFSLRDAAKKIQQRPNKFSEWLRSEGYLCINNLPRQQYINQGLFKTHTGQSREEFQFSQTRVTSKGLAYFTNKLGERKL